MVLVVRLVWLQDPADQLCVLGGLETGVSEQRVDRGQTGFATGGAVAADVLQVLEELADGGRVQVGEVQLVGQFAGALVQVRQQQLECVTVGGDRVRAGVLLVHQPVGEEPLG